MIEPHVPQAADTSSAARREALHRLAADVHYYLTQHPRQLPSRYLYDDLGSALFEAICRLPWYPITRAEGGLLAAHRTEIFRTVAPLSAIVELGSGSGEKLGLLLGDADWGSRGLTIHLVDLSRAALDAAARRIAALDGVRVVTHEATYEAGLDEAARPVVPRDPMLVLFLGSNIGNFDPPACDALLRGIRGAMRPGDTLLLGADLVKPARTLQLAYDDPLGVTAAFNRNLLVRVNRELDGNFDIDQFVHRAVWNDSDSRVEMHLVARVDQHVRIAAADLEFTMAAGEPIWTESSYKYRPHEIGALLGATGFDIARQWLDERDQFALTLAEAV